MELTKRRAAQEGFVGRSFATIAGAGPNGAVIHYRAQPGTCRTVDKDTLLLLDSGGQYDCGTTDITRTVHLGTPSDRHKLAFTRVLQVEQFRRKDSLLNPGRAPITLLALPLEKNSSTHPPMPVPQGHIALDQVVFPEGTPGCAIDALARLPLWREGLNYRHGTGHGVGAALNVHEGPQSIASRFHITTPLAPRMVCSNEPGYYEDGSFGVRIENLVVVTEVDTPNRWAGGVQSGLFSPRRTRCPRRFGGASFMGFVPLTLVPIQTKMIDQSLLSPHEVAWIDRYHQQVWKEVSPRLQGNERALQWLKDNVVPLASAS